MEWENFEQMAKSLSWKYAQMVHIPYEDLFSVCTIGFTIANNTYNPELAKESTHVYNSMMFQIGRLIRKEKRIASETDVFKELHSTSVTSYNNFLDLPKELFDIVMLVLDPPEGSVFKNKQAILNYLVGKGLKKPFIRKAFQQIKEAL